MSALEKLNLRIEESFFNKDSTITIVLWMPTSDIGKWTIVAHMLSFLEDSDAIKFDWLLNTNWNWRHTAVWWDDFGIYEKYNPWKKFSDEKYILWGYLYTDFINRYWEDENLCFRPHMRKHFVATICEIYQKQNKPKNFIIEIWWTIIDHEVDSYVSPAISFLKKELWNRCKLVLVTTTDRNWKYIKTRVVQRAVEALSQRFIIPDIILAREPSYIPITSNIDKSKNESIIGNKLYEMLWLTIEKENIISVPYYKPENIDELWEYLKNRLYPLFCNKKKIFLWTTNPWKIADYKSHLSEYDIITSNDLWLDISIEENDYSLIENSQKKALIWAHASWLPTISEDTWFFIKELNWKPWVSVKTWWGEIKDKISEDEYLKFVIWKINSLSNTESYFYTVLSLWFPNWEVVSLTDITEWILDKKKANNIANQWYPLSAIFVANWRTKTRSEMDNDEKNQFSENFIFKIKWLLNTYKEKIW